MHLKFAAVEVTRLWSAYKKICWLYKVRLRARTDFTSHMNQELHHCQT